MKPIISFPMLGEGFSINPTHYFEVFGIPIYWYGVIIATGFVLAVFYCMHRCQEFGLTVDNILDMLIIATPLSLVGARLYYVVFNFSLYEDDLMGIFRIRDGGIAIYGAVIFAALGLYIAARVRKFSPYAMMDLGSFGLLIGQSVGRWGNFINREAFGADTGIFCRMGLTDPISGITRYVHPTFLYESLWNLMGLILMHVLSKKMVHRFDGQYALIYIAWYGFGRMLIEGLRTDSLYLYGNIRVSQLLAAVSCAAALIALRKLMRRPYNPQYLWKNKKV